MWRNDDLYVALWQMGRPGTEPPDPLVAVRAGKRAATTLPACPLMHGTGLFITLSTLVGRRHRRADRRDGPRRRRGSGARSSATRSQVLTIVGDVFARPLLDALDAEPDRWDLSSLRAITSSGVTWSPEVKRGAARPPARRHDARLARRVRGPDEPRSAARAGDAEIAPARFAVNDRVQGRHRRRARGRARQRRGRDGRASAGRIPLGYYKDPGEDRGRRSGTVDGVRYSIPGDYATVDADGTIRLLGRGSATVNTGGEKVYPEEVELVAAQEHRRRTTASSSACPTSASARWWSRWSVTDGYHTDEAELRAFCKEPRARRVQDPAPRPVRRHCAARRTARPTTSCCARWPQTELGMTGD